MRLLTVRVPDHQEVPSMPALPRRFILALSLLIVGVPLWPASAQTSSPTTITMTAPFAGSATDSDCDVAPGCQVDMTSDPATGNATVEILTAGGGAYLDAGQGPVEAGSGHARADATIIASHPVAEEDGISTVSYQVTYHVNPSWFVVPPPGGTVELILRPSHDSGAAVTGAKTELLYDHEGMLHKGDVTHTTTIQARPAAGGTFPDGQLSVAFTLRGGLSGWSAEGCPPAPVNACVAARTSVGHLRMDMTLQRIEATLS
jgi:hypothetical protein